MHTPQKLVMTDPCSLHWDDLEMAEGGRNCKQCNKLIIDFSDSTQKEIHAAYESSTAETGEFCGRFKVSQVLQLSRPKFTWRKSVMRRFALSVLLVFGAFLFNLADSKANAYLASIRSVADQTFDGGGSVDTTSAKHRIVGVVKDSTTGEPLIGATVLLEYNGQVYGAMTDIDGRYVLNYSYVETSDSAQAKYSVKYIGYKEHIQTEINPELTSQEINVALFIEVIEIDMPAITHCMGKMQNPTVVHLEQIPRIEIVEPDADYYRTDELNFSDDN